MNHRPYLRFPLFLSLIFGLLFVSNNPPPELLGGKSHQPVLPPPEEQPAPLPVSFVYPDILRLPVEPGTGQWPGTTSIETASTGALYLPVVFTGDPFLSDLPIWTHLDTPASSEVGLFRRHFVLGEPLDDAEIFLLADTRYEVWLDGEWLGRGPARFTRTYQEYDRYPLGRLEPGEHAVAVLVQWAPNARRSESQAPFLRGHIAARTLEGGSFVLLRTDEDWQAFRSPAWQNGTALVHSSYLVGPTEVLDLRLLARDWTAVAFGEVWGPAQVLGPGANRLLAAGALPDPAVRYAPRSIPPLTHSPVAASVLDAGRLSPAYFMIEVDGSSPEQAFLFETSAPVTVLMESLVTGAGPVIRVDQNKLDWRAAGANRPDVFQAQVQVRKGKHIIELENIPNSGSLFNISKKDIYGLGSQVLPHGSPGKRLLLAEPVSDASQVVQRVTGDGLQLEFLEPPAFVVLDLGRTVHGRLSAQVEGPAGSLLDIGWDERLLPGTLRPLPHPGSLHPQWSQADAWILDGSPRTIQTLDARAGRYVVIGVWGSGPVVLRNLQVFEERYPVEPLGQFQSADPVLDQVWQVGALTTQMNMLDAYADPWRERGQWWGDAFIVDQVNQVAFGDSALLRRGLLLMAENYRAGGFAPALAPHGVGTDYLDYFMLWVIKLADYGRRTNDLEFVRQNYGIVVDFFTRLAAFSDPSTHLLEAPAGGDLFFYLDTLGASSRTGQTAAPNALYYGALRAAADLAFLVGDQAQAQTWEAAAESLRAGFNQRFYLPAEGRYLTGWLGETPLPPNAHAQAFALAYGLVPPEERPRVAQALLLLTGTDPAAPAVEIYGFYWVLEALGRAGEVSRMVELIKVYYGYMLERGATTWWERFDADQKHWLALSHGWGSGPAYLLTHYLLGLQRTGADEWRLEPALEGVDYVSGSLPLLNGGVKARWERMTCERSTVRVHADETVTGEVVLNTAGDQDAVLETVLEAVYEGDRLLWQAGAVAQSAIVSEAGRLHLPVAGGRIYDFQLVFSCTP